MVINWEFGFFLEIRFLALIWRLIFYKQSSLGQLRVEVSPRSRIFASLRREGFARFPVVGLGKDPGLFLPVALSGKFYVCSTTVCFYYVNSAGSIQCTVKGSPPRTRVCIKENLLCCKVRVIQISQLKFVKKISFALKLVVGFFDPWLTLLADSKSYRMWLPDILSISES